LSIIRHKVHVMASVFFELMAEMDLTKHSGGLSATNELLQLCQIDDSKHVLDVGCGVGMTACYVARKFGCRVVGIDILDSMIDRSRERARRRGIEKLIDFRVADVLALPFDDEEFDIVIGESIMAFVQDKQKGVDEAVRVTKKGGYFGITETAWLEDPSPENLITLNRSFGGIFNPLTADGWEQLLLHAGLRDIVTSTHDVTVMSEVVNRLRRLGFIDFTKALYKAVSLIRTKPFFRDALRTTISDPKELLDSWEYGIFVGKK
jgi:arsenite methyltransferase